MCEVRTRWGSINGVRYQIYGTPAPFGDPRNLQSADKHELCLMEFQTKMERNLFDVQVFSMPTQDGRDGLEFLDARGNCFYVSIQGNWYKRWVQ